MISDGTSDFILCGESMLETYNSSIGDYQNSSSCSIEFPFWLNSNSSLSIKFYSEADMFCTVPIESKVLISLMEFNITD